MSKLRAALNGLNQVLSTLNLQLDTLTAARLERQRLREIDRRGWFDQPVYPLPASFTNPRYQRLLDELPKYRERFDTFARAEANDVGFQFDNGFYGSPDAEVLYAMVRTLRPRRIVEIGCGNSTRIIRQAIRDGQIDCKHIGIDPQPRREVSGLVDMRIDRPIEDAGAEAHIEKLDAGDILFIDTSHEVKPANDVAYIYGRLVPGLSAGVIVHIHDIFIPYEYPRAWLLDTGRKWGEQYIVQAIVMNSANWEVLWPGYFLQRTLPEFARHFPYLSSGYAQSLWLRRT
jgi:predicted O-methyltransferase YrrM